MEQGQSNVACRVEAVQAGEHVVPAAGSDADAVAVVDVLRQRIDALEALLAKSAAGEQAPPDRQFEPELDVYENDREFLILATVPGAEPQQIRIEATRHTVTLSADIAAMPNAATNSSDPAHKRHRRSRHADHDRYHFVYTLHAAILPEAARAAFRNGIVEIRLFKEQNSVVSAAVPVLLDEDASFAHSSPSHPHALPVGGPLQQSAREGSPGQKLGASYAANPSEDHATKAQSVGEQSAPGQRHTRADRLRTAESGV